VKIGVWINSDYRPEAGGGFSYYDRLIRAIDSYTFSHDLDVCFVTVGDTPLPVKRDCIRLSARIKATITERVKKHLPLVGWHYKELLDRRFAILRMASYRQQLTDKGVRLIFYPTPGRIIPDFPFIATNWDIGHLSTFAFPEVCMNGQFDTRNNYYTSVLPKALMTFCESEAGKQELIRFTNISGEKLKVVPIFAGGCIDENVDEERQHKILAQYRLVQNRYFFYPAQFWAHKNHWGLLQAFKMFVREHPDFKLVLTGSDKGNLPYIKKLIETYSLTDKVIFPGFVPLETIYTFYSNASAVVMASYFGPTNMPPLEAMALGCPVVCTDIEGHHEELGDAALYFNAQDSDSLLTCLEEVVEHNGLYREKIKAQQSNTPFRIETALERINTYFSEASNIRATWE